MSITFVQNYEPIISQHAGVVADGCISHSADQTCTAHPARHRLVGQRRHRQTISARHGLCCFFGGGRNVADQRTGGQLGAGPGVRAVHDVLQPDYRHPVLPATHHQSAQSRIPNGDVAALHHSQIKTGTHRTRHPEAEGGRKAQMNTPFGFRSLSVLRVLFYKFLSVLLIVVNALHKYLNVFVLIQQENAEI